MLVFCLIGLIAGTLIANVRLQFPFPALTAAAASNISVFNDNHDLTQLR